MVNELVVEERQHLEQATHYAGSRFERQMVPRGGQLQQVVVAVITLISFLVVR